MEANKAKAMANYRKEEKRLIEKLKIQNYIIGQQSKIIQALESYIEKEKGQLLQGRN